MDAKTEADLKAEQKPLPTVATVKGTMEADLNAALKKALAGFELEGNKRGLKVVFEAFVAVGGQFAEANGMSTRSRYKYASKGVSTGTTITPSAPEHDDADDSSDDSEGDSDE